MNKLSPYQSIAIALVAAAAVFISKSNNRYTIREAISQAADAFYEAEENRIGDSEEAQTGLEFTADQEAEL